jgi:hypothetical protein
VANFVFCCSPFLRLNRGIDEKKLEAMSESEVRALDDESLAYTNMLNWRLALTVNEANRRDSPSALTLFPRTRLVENIPTSRYNDTNCASWLSSSNFKPAS